MHEEDDEPESEDEDDEESTKDYQLVETLNARIEELRQQLNSAKKEAKQAKESVGTTITRFQDAISKGSKASASRITELVKERDEATAKVEEAQADRQIGERAI